MPESRPLDANTLREKHYEKMLMASLLAVVR
jgi:hypothetical protein